MKFVQLEIKNWSRFRYPTVISLETTNERNVILIHSLNDRGKTSIFYAIKYALYGERGLSTHPTEVYTKLSSWPNIVSAREGDGVMSVELKFITDDKKEYRIQRDRKFFQTPTGIEEIQLENKEELNIFDSVGPIDVGKNKQDWIDANVLPYEASQFFLFDGEVIQGYMRQVGKKVKEAIEQVLGLKELTNAEEDVGNLLKTLTEEWNKKIRLDKKNNKEANEIDDLEEKIKKNKEDRRSVIASRNGAGHVQDDCNKKLAKYREIKLKIDEKVELLKEVTNDEKTKDELTEQLRHKRDYAGLLLLNPLLSIILQTEETPPSKQQWMSRAASHMLENKFGDCVCETKIDEGITKKLKVKVLELTDNPFSRLKRRVEDIISAHKPDAKNVELDNIINNISDAKGRISSNSSAAKTISDEILNSTVIGEEVKGLERKAKEASEQIVKDDITIQGYDKKINQQESRVQDLRIRVSSSSANKELSEAKDMNDFTITVKDAFHTAFNEYYKKRKPELEKHISDVFISLTNNPELYKGIILGDDFSIQIKRYDGSLLPSYRYSPSAGAAQIAATALIGGLNRFTTRNAPVVIDTPLARLDPIHKENLLNYYKDISKQVIILPQPDEIDKKEEEIISDYVEKKYEIISKSGEPDTSVIVVRD